MAAAGEEVKARAGGGESGIRASLWPYLYCVRYGKIRRRRFWRFCGADCKMTRHRTSRSSGAAATDHAYPIEKMAVGMKRISTHVLDTARGKPARGVPVRLEQQEKSGNWVPLGSARTDQDGRCAQLLPDDKVLSAGLYRLTFDTGSYFAAAEDRGFVSGGGNYVSGAGWRNPFSYSAAAEPERIYDLPGKLSA